MTESANRPGAVESEILLLQWMVGLVIVLATAVVALLAPHLAPHPLDAYESHPAERLQEPSRAFPRRRS